MGGAQMAMLWYPLDFQTWDGHLPIVVPLYILKPHILMPNHLRPMAVPFVAYACCGKSKCKGTILLMLLKTYALLADRYALSGGMKPYCIRCGATTSSSALYIQDSVPHCQECATDAMGLG